MSRFSLGAIPGKLIEIVQLWGQKFLTVRLETTDTQLSNNRLNEINPLCVEYY